MLKRLNPSLVVSILALVVAMSGTAIAAGVLVKTPSQLADAVITNPKIATGAVSSRAVAQGSLSGNDLQNGAITNAKLSHPIYAAAVESDGTVAPAQSTGVDETLTRKSEQVGGGVVYDVGFDKDVSRCVYSATPGENDSGGNLRPVFLDVTPSSNPRVVSVFVRDTTGSLFSPERPSFHLIVVC
jgi:hypothetical protein